MSLESQVGRSIIDLGEVLTSNVITELAKSNTEGKFNITQEDLSTVAEIIKATVYTTCMGAVDGFSATVKNGTEELLRQSAMKTTSTKKSNRK